MIGLLKERNFGYLKIDYNDSIGVRCDGAESDGEGLRRHTYATMEFFKKIKHELPEMLSLVSLASFSDAHETVYIPIIASNLRRVSISPWCNEEKMGEILRRSKIVYHRKPSPNFLGVGSALDEEALRSHIRRTVNAAKGCNLEFTQRDVYTVGKDIGKVKRYVEIVREECHNF